MEEEPLPVTRKKALLRILSAAAAKQRALVPSASEFADFSAAFRRAFAIDDEQRLQRWLNHSRLDRKDFERMLLELCLQSKLEEHLATHIDREVTLQQAIWTLHSWAHAERAT
ncbi:MAG TPA: hypothetical protein VFQ35_22310 [Polyangiaceae bacterium]|nr:hypothetical protein [Polyangiaceae bacterium]